MTNEDREYDKELIELRHQVAGMVMSYRTILESSPHPGDGFRSKDKTLFDYASYTLRFGRMGGLKKLKRLIEASVKSQTTKGE